jgi:hypothetical protein
VTLFQFFYGKKVSVATDSMLVSPDPLDLAMCDTGLDSIVRTLCMPILKRIGHLP